MRKLFTFFVLSLISYTVGAQKEPGQSPLNPDFVDYIELKTSDKQVKFTAEGYALGIIPSPVSPVLKPVKSLQNKSFDESYDLRDQGGVSSVKDQGNCGSCWTFSTMGSIESHWLLQGLGEYDLSEDNLNNCHPFDWEPCEGGNLNISASMLSSGKGPQSETDDPYSGSDDNTCPSGLTPVAYVPDIWWVDTSRTSIKQALTDYGALYVSMYWYNDAFNSSNNTYYYTGSGDGSDGGGGHGITLVGWDDNKVTDASQPGAWIVKNSWGDSWGESGYFYISYYDNIAFSSVGVFPNRVDYSSEVEIYGYDECGWVTSYGYGDGEDAAVVKFTASEDQTLEKIGSYAVASNSILSIEIYDDFDGSALSNKLGELLNQNCEYAGYHTFDLNSSIDITSGNDFYVKLMYNTSTDYPVPMEMQYAGYCSSPIESSGKAWVSSDGTSWTALGSDITDKEYDPAIKVYAINKSGSNSSSESGLFTWLHPKPQGNNIYGSHFLSESLGFVCGAAGTVMKTSDGGTSWSVMNTDTLAPLYAIHFLSEDTGFVSGYGFIKRTVDGGTTWNYVEESEVDPINDITFIDDTTGIAVVNYGTILRTVDKGETWEALSTGSSSSLYDVLFLSSAKGFAVGTSGAILSTIDSGKTWTENTYGTESLKKIFFVDSNTGFVVGDDGTLYKTTDGGSGWTASATGISEYKDLDDVYFEDANTGLAVGEDYIYKTTDGGSNWTQSFYDYKKDHNIIVKTGTSAYLTMGDPAFIMKTTDAGDNWTFPFSKIYENIQGIDFISSTVGYAVAYGDSSLKTTDGGNTWETVQLDEYMRDILAIDANTAIAVGNNGKAFKTTNGGESWTNNGIDTYDDLYAIDKATDNVFYAVGTDTLVMKTTDAGDSWTEMTPLGMTEFKIYDVSFINEKLGFVVGGSSNEAQIFMTSDGGNQWSEIASPVEKQLNSVEFVNDSVGFICGADAVILKSVDSGKTWVQQNVTIPSGFSLDDFSEIAMFDESSGLVAGDLGLVFTTTDGGTTWNYAENITREGLRDIDLVNGSAIISGYDGVIMKYDFGYEASLAADFTADQTSGNAPLTVNFTDQSTGDVTSWSWDFDGDGNEDATSQNPSYEYSTAGTYTVSLTVGDGSGTDTKTRSDYIVVSESVAADFTADKTSGIAPLTVNFTDQSTGDVTVWSWDFDGDGNEDATSQNPSYEYSTAGTYTVSLTVGDGSGTDTKTRSDYIVVSESVAADFSADATTGYAPLTVNFTDNSTGSISTWEWDFNNDGTIDATTQNPSYEYTEAGTYSVSLTVGDGTSTVTETKTDYIIVNEPVVADFTADATSGDAPLTVNFTDNSTGNITTWEWDFDNDGNVDATTQNPSYEYTQAGNYTVALTVGDGTSTDTKTKTDYITVTETSDCDWDFASSNYEMNFEDTDDLSAWTIIDANSDDNTWVIATAGGVDGSGCAGYSYSSTNAANDWLVSRCFNLEAGKEYEVNFYYKVEDSGFPEKLKVYYGDAAETSALTQQVVDLGEISNTSYEKSSSTISISTAGTYYFVWNAYSDADMWNLYIDSIKISEVETEALAADFSASVTSGQAPLTVDFTDESSGNVSTWSWDFNGDGNEDATTQNPSYEYTEAGTYSVSLTVGDGSGTDTQTKTDYITVSEASSCDWNFAGSDFIMNFETTDDLSNWLYFDVNNDGKHWEVVSGSGIDDTYCARYSYSEVNNADDWLISRCFTLEEGVSYKVEFQYAVEAETMPEKLKFAMGDAQAPSAMTEIIDDLGEITNEDYMKSEKIINVSATGDYYFGWQAYSNANNWNVYIDSVKIGETEETATSTAKLAKNSVDVYPNPSSGWFNVEMDDYNQLQRIEVVTIEGARVMELSEKEVGKRKIDVNLGEMPAGIYFLKIYRKNTVITKKLIKQ